MKNGSESGLDKTQNIVQNRTFTPWGCDISYTEFFFNSPLVRAEVIVMKGMTEMLKQF